MKGTLIFTLALLLGFAGFLTTGFAQTYAHHDTLNEGTGLARALAFSPDGTLLASGGGSNVYLHAPGTGMLQRTLRGHTATVTVVDFSPDGRMLASASGDRTIKLWNPQTGRNIGTLRGHTDQIYAMAFSRTGQLASGGRDNTVRLWNTQTGANSVIGRHNGWVLGIAFSSTGLLASSGRDNTIRIWNATTAAQLRTLTGHTDFVTSVAFTATGSTLVSGSRDNTIRIWNAATGGAALQTLRGHTDNVNSVAVSANGTIASASADETVRLWNPQTGRFATFDEHTDLVRVVAFSRDGQYLASGSEDGAVQLWKRSGPDETQVVAPPVVAPPVVEPPVEDAALLVDQVLEKYLVTLERADIYDVLMAALVALKAPNIQAVLNPQIIAAVVANPDLLTAFAPAIDPTFVTLLKTDAELQAMFRDVQVQELIQNPGAIDLLVSLFGWGTTGVVEPAVEPAVEDAAVHIPDAELADAIREELLGLDEEAPITAAAMRELTQLDASHRGIVDLTGLQHATQLQMLDLSYTKVSDVSPLAKLPNLGWLELSGTNVSDISALAKLTNLIKLGLNRTDVSDVSALAKLTNLRELYLTGNHVSDVSTLAKLTNLESLFLSETNVSDVSALANLTNLEWLDLAETDVSDVSALANLTNLQTLDLRGCPLSHAAYHTHIPALQAKGITVSLKQIDIPDASLAAAIRETLGLGEGAPITAAAMRELTELDANGPRIVDLTGLQHATQLKTLNLRWTNVSDVSALANLTNLVGLRLDKTNVSDVSALANLTQLEWLRLDYTYVSDVSALANLTQLEYLALDYTGVSDVSALANLTNLTTLALIGTYVSDVSALANLTNLERLFLISTGVSDVSALANLTNLERLFLIGTGVSDVSALANLTNLEWLRLDYTGVSDVSALANLTQLKTLNLDYTGVSDVSALANLTNLEWLDLDGCPLSHASRNTHIPALQAKGIRVSLGQIDILPDAYLAEAIRRALGLDRGAPITITAMRELTALGPVGWQVADLTGLPFATQLKTLNLGGTDVLNVLALGRLTQLKTLNLGGTGVSDVSALGHLTQLKTLDLGGTNVSNVFALGRLTQLKTLDLGGTNVSDVSALGHLTQLKTLDLGGTYVSDVSALANLTNLQTLDLSRTYLSSIYQSIPNVSDVSALANLTQLKTLDLRWTDVSDVSALANLTNLQTLDLYETNVSDVSALANLTNLQTLDLYETNVSDVSALANLTQLKTLNLRVTHVSDVSALANLTNLQTLDLYKTNVSDVSALANLTQLKTLHLDGCPLNNAAHETHIPAMQAKGVEVHFNRRPTAYETHTKLIYGLWLGASKDSNDRPLPNEGGDAFIPLEQPTDDTCGPTSVEMVLHYYGKEATMADVFEKGGIHTVYIGTTPSEMKKALNGLGVPARYHDEDTRDYGSSPLAHLRSYIDQNRLPCILVRVPSGYHWMVAVGYYKDDEFLLADPSDGGFVWVDSDDLKNAWNFEKDLRGGRTSFSRGFNYGKDLDLLDLAAIAIDPYTIIVPDDAPDTGAHLYGMWSEMKSFRMTGTDEFLGDVRGWDETIEFNHKFDFYKAVGIPELLSHGGWLGLPKLLFPGTAELTGSEPVGEKSVKLWGRIEDGWKKRGRMQVIVRTYRYKESPAAPAQTVSTRLSASPAETSLLPNYPNPFNPETWIPYQLAKPADVAVSIYAVDGTLVRRLDLGQMPSGVYRSRARAAYWDGRNAAGEPVASGIYFYTLQAGDFISTRKMVIRK